MGGADNVVTGTSPNVSASKLLGSRWILRGAFRLRKKGWLGRCVPAVVKVAEADAN